MLTSLSSKGWEIGSHTRTHPDLTHLSDFQANAELRDSKTTLENITSTHVTSLAYPSAAYDSRIKSIAARYYEFARADSSYPPLRVNSLHPHDRMELKAMGDYQHPWAIPLHLFDNHIARKIKYHTGSGKPRSLNPNKGWIKSSHRGLEARLVKNWLRHLRKDQWLILTFHDISANDSRTSYAIGIDEFHAMVKAIEQSAEIVNLGDGAEKN